MKRICSFLGILSAVILWPFLSWAQVGENYNIEIEGRYWKPKLDSAVKIVEDGVGTEFKAVNDLGFDERKDFGEARLQIKFARKHKFNFSVIPLKWDGDKVITQTIEFSGKTFTAGTRVQSKLDLNLYKAGYEYDFLAERLGFLGGTFDILLADVRMELKASTLALDEKEDAAVPIPMVGLIGRIYPVRWVNLTARVSGLPMGRYGHVIDAEASLNINPIKFVGISAGYRYFESKAENEDNTLKFKLDGPFVALKIRF